MKKIILHSLLLSPFLDGLYLRNVLPFDFYYYYIIFIIGILYAIFNYGQVPIPKKWFALPVLLVIISGLVLNFQQSLGNKIFYVQLFGIVFTSLAYRVVFIIEKDKISIIKIFYKISIWVAVFGVFQFVFFKIGIQIGRIVFDEGLGGLRIAGLCGEPYFLAINLLPAFYISLLSLIKRKKLNFVDTKKTLLNTILLFIAIALTFSSAGFIGLLLCILLISYKVLFNKFSFKSVLLICLLVLISIPIVRPVLESNAFVSRFEDSYNLVVNPNYFKDKGSEINASSFSLFSNAYIAFQSFKENPISGGGIGSHPLSYDKFIRTLVPIEVARNYGEKFNSMDANSLFLRLISETGLIGIIVFLFFLLKFRNKEPADNTNKIVNEGILILFLMRLLRTGNFVGNGMFLFVYLYHDTAKLEPTVINGN
jgi:hypothetical protein